MYLSREILFCSPRGKVLAGREIVIDMDLKTFFDVVNHDRLTYRLSETIGDKTLLRLIRKYLQCGIIAVSYTHLDVYKRQIEI